MRLRWLLAVLLVWGCSSDGKQATLDVSGQVDATPDTWDDLRPCRFDGCGSDGRETPDLPAEQRGADGLEEVGCGDACLPDWECTPGSTLCEGNAVTTCLEDGSGWTVSVPCESTKTCADGVCAEWPEGVCATAYECMAGLSCQDADLSCIQDCLQGLPVGIEKYAKELFWCVVTHCGDDWLPESACFAEVRLDECKPLFDTCTGVCLPDCGKKECGADGCGGSCGECEEGFACDPNGKCLCQPDCEGKECGPNGCGAQCGVCAGRKPICNEEQLCVPEPPGPCGNGQCEGELDETCFSCPLDCGECPPCGDGTCEELESCEFCPADCGPCPYGDCCAYHDFPGCGDADVVECVCGIEPDCCLYPWHNDCVELAADCGADC
jgi:hypothetical protein